MNFLFVCQLAVNVQDKKNQDSAEKKVDTKPTDKRIIEVSSIKKNHKP